MLLLMALTSLTLINSITQTKSEELRERRVTRPALRRPEPLSRAELLELWRGMRPDPEAQEDPSSESKEKHVTNGRETKHGEFPWQAGLILYSNHFCGGSLVSVRHVLTAAHCTRNTTTFTVILGSQNKDLPTENGRLVLTTSQVAVHPRFHEPTVQNDIALLTLPEPVNTTEFIQPVRLPRKSDLSRTLVGLKTSVSGFGITANGQTNASSVLRVAQMKIVANAECVRVFGKGSVTRNNICTKSKTKQGACRGDSGGALTVQERDGKWTQVGIVSYGLPYRCGQGNPDVFTRVANFLPFLEAKAPSALSLRP